MIEIDFNTYVLGARLFYWVYFGLSLLGFGTIVIYFKREWIKEKWYKLRHPEQAIEIWLIYPGNWLRNFWRLIPLRTHLFFCPGGPYLYSDKAVLKNERYYAYEDPQDNDSWAVKIEDKEYKLDKKSLLKKRWEPYPKIVYEYGNPFPVGFFKRKEGIPLKEGEKPKEAPELTWDTTILDKFRKSKFLEEIFSSVAGKGLIMAILILGVMTFLAVAVVLAINVGLIHLPPIKA